MGILERFRGRKTAQSIATEMQAEPTVSAQSDLDQQHEPEVGLSAPEQDAPPHHPQSIRATRALEVDEEAAYQRHLDRLRAHGIPEPGAWTTGKEKPATVADVARLYDVNPIFTNLMPWIE